MGSDWLRHMGDSIPLLPCKVTQASVAFDLKKNLERWCGSILHSLVTACPVQLVLAQLVGSTLSVLGKGLDSPGVFS